MVGYSFGADVLPFVYNDLATGVKSHIGRVSLLGFANAADWEIQVEGWLGAAPVRKPFRSQQRSSRCVQRWSNVSTEMRGQKHSATRSPGEVSR
ncbi:hypothetical protein FJ543_21970 [Mesorhizobium sp. B2-5-7]|nr:hypothetical protein FJ543_21970 [Mesorhizobium sp. B2-5-7]